MTAPRSTRDALRVGPSDLKTTNDSYGILISSKTWTERYYRDKDGWLKVIARGRKFRAAAEQVLNHVLPRARRGETKSDR